MLSVCGCTTKKVNLKTELCDLPKLSMPSDEVALEIEQLCKNPSECFHLNDWFNKLYRFEAEYSKYIN
jgi:hypothetical protein